MSNTARYRLRMSALVVFLLLVYLAGNGRVALFDRDEPRYAVTSRAMLESGDWVVPRFLGEVRTAKPPAIYWLQASAMALLGRGEFAVRLPGALACAGTVAMLAITLPPIVGRRRAGWACFTLGTSVLVLGVAKVGVIDGVLLPCAATVQVCLLYLIYGKGRPILLATLLWLAIGIGGLLKGPVILGVLAMTLLAWGAMTWIRASRLRKPAPSVRSGAAWSKGGTVSPSVPSLGALLKRIRPGLGLLIVVLVVAPWLVAIEVRSPGFVWTSISHDVLERSASGLEGHGQPPGFHLLTLFGTWFPWSVLLPGALFEAWRRRGRPFIAFALAASVGPWVMFEIVVTKLPHYLLPIFPMLAVLTADWIVRARRGRIFLGRPGLWAAAVIYALVALGFGAACVILEVPSIPAMVLSLLWAIVLATAWWRGRVQVGVLSAGLGMALVVATAFLDWLPRAPVLNVSRQVAATLGEAGAQRAPMIDYKEPSLAWYAGEVGVVGVQVWEADEAAFTGDTRFAVTTARELERLPPHVRDQWRTIARIPTRLYNDRLASADVLVVERVD